MGGYMLFFSRIQNVLLVWIWSISYCVENFFYFHYLIINGCVRRVENLIRFFMIYC